MQSSCEKKVCVVRRGSEELLEKVCVDRMRSRGVQQQHDNDNNRPHEIAVRAFLNFHGVVVGIAKANQNQHGMDLHGQSAICLPCFGPRVAFFRTGAVGLQAIDAFFTF